MSRSALGTRRPRRRQRGVGVLAITLIIGLIAFFATLLVKLGPVYMADMTLGSILEKAATAPEPIPGGRTGVLNYITRSLDVNDVDGIDPRAFKFASAGEGRYQVSIEYERRTHLFFNVDAVLTFTHAVEVKTQ
jgi:hypothetical protein